MLANKSTQTISLKQRRWIELVILFLLTPLLLYAYRTELSGTLLPLIFASGALCLYILLQDKRFKRFRLMNRPGFQQWLRPVLLLFLGLILSTTLAFYAIAQSEPFTMPYELPWSWLLLLFVYPLFSALPQEIIFRTYLFHRYKTIIPNKQHRALLSSICFGYAHILYANWIAVLLATIAGYFFCQTYIQSRSTALVAVEHSLWGIWIFTLGLGAHFDSNMIV